ncbi:hypothetical protein BJX70DRAFT_355763 [Aspergillus crustosus]
MICFFSAMWFATSICLLSLFLICSVRLFYLPVGLIYSRKEARTSFPGDEFRLADVVPRVPDFRPTGNRSLLLFAFVSGSLLLDLF